MTATTAELLDDLVCRGRRRRHDVAAWQTDRSHLQLVLRDGRLVESTATTVPLLRMSAADRSGGFRSLAVATRIGAEELLDVLERVPSLPKDDPAADLPAADCLKEVPARAQVAPPARADQVEAAAVGLFENAGGPDLEIRVEQLTEVVTARAATRSGSYGQSRCSVQLRVTGSGRQPGLREAWFHAQDLSSALAGARQDLARLREEVDYPVTRLSGRRSVPIVIEGEVGAQLLALATKSLSAEAVLAGRGALPGDALGARAASPMFAVVDDPQRDGAPLAPLFDDEGFRCKRRELVVDGVVVDLLGSSATASLGGVRPGNGWSSDRLAPPRPAGSNLVIEASGADRQIIPHDVMRIVQCQGLHMANDITGEFAMAATVTLGDRRGEQVLVAGNVFDLLERAVPVGRSVSWFAGSSTYYGSGDMYLDDWEVQQ
ncbi:metallopeptidase TldD-related protein [Cellulosimicrobium cellulans]|uniref:metallopeptidase TldD-related protein n=1 Tax=Cellulosimicrobium cellulans TaxID=1710 RepID=UPI003826CE9A